MARKPTDTAHLNLRYPEALRRRLERAAKNGGRSMNTEIVERLEQSFRREDFEKLQDAMNLGWLKIMDVVFDVTRQLPPSRGPGLLDLRDISPEQLRQLFERPASTD
jgi:Arc-like DNA binding domain